MWALLVGYAHHALVSVLLAVRRSFIAVYINGCKHLALDVETIPQTVRTKAKKDMKPLVQHRHICHPWNWHWRRISVFRSKLSTPTHMLLSQDTVWSELGRSHNKDSTFWKETQILEPFGNVLDTIIAGHIQRWNRRYWGYRDLSGTVTYRGRQRSTWPLGRMVADVRLTLTCLLSWGTVNFVKNRQWGKKLLIIPEESSHGLDI